MKMISNMAHMQYQLAQYLVKVILQVWWFYLMNWLGYRVNKLSYRGKTDGRTGVDDDNDPTAEGPRVKKCWQNDGGVGCWGVDRSNFCPDLVTAYHSSDQQI